MQTSQPERLFNRKSEIYLIQLITGSLQLANDMTIQKAQQCYSYNQENWWGNDLKISTLNKNES